MKWKNQTKFKISGLNQEKLLNELSKSFTLSDIDRQSKNNTTFSCGFFEHKKVEKILKNKGVKVESVTHEGVFFLLKKALTSYGLIAALVVFSALFFLQNNFVVQYEVTGLDKLSKTEVVDFVKSNFPSKKSALDTEAVEIGLIENFERVSFASCIIKGQTLVINIKEKLLPDEMYGGFAPLVASEDGKITQINLISGTLRVKVGDIVKKGEVLVDPYTIDTSGQMKKVDAKAEILADVYFEGMANHYQHFIEVVRTGNVVVQNDITLFGLSIYNFKEENNFKMYEVETEDVDLIKNLFLPFKMRKTYIYELKENVIESNFEDVKEEIVAKAKEKALEKCGECDNIKDEFYTIRHLSGVTIVNFCIVIEQQLAVYQNS